ncbi:MAG: hypothetical protein EAZ13_10220 [Sphingobacteriia bacterium]|nr:MAG: hypothetical protein EAZ41_02970 [Sphingobacteriia bacterium]TAG29263.1 MAG: hypothetical protein EAZ35_11365 [Sphingobacteriia bacterium]TAH06228.1 MAG: hypothetical protein EAZ13_10220 [Sphingobacteriia bacterium]
MNRDLLVLSNQNYLTPEQVNLELAALDRILFSVENWPSFCTANDIIDINRHKIITKTYLVQKILQDNPNKSFLFICNKN